MMQKSLTMDDVTDSCGTPKTRIFRNETAADQLFEEKKDNYNDFLNELKSQTSYRDSSNCTKCLKRILYANTLRKNFQSLSKEVKFSKTKRHYVYSRRFNRNAKRFDFQKQTRMAFCSTKNLIKKLEKRPNTRDFLNKNSNLITNRGE